MLLNFFNPILHVAVLIGMTTATASVPLPGSRSHLIGGFSIKVTHRIAIAYSPEWKIRVPSIANPKKSYGIDVYEAGPDGAFWFESYIAQPHGAMVTTSPSTCPIPPSNGIECPSLPLVPGKAYVFELVESPLLNQIPRTILGIPSAHPSSRPPIPVRTARYVVSTYNPIAAAAFRRIISLRSPIIPMRVARRRERALQPTTPTMHSSLAQP